MRSTFLLEKLKDAEIILEADGVEFIKAVYGSVDADEIKRATAVYYKWKAHSNPWTEDRKFFDFLGAALTFDGDAATMMTSDVEEFRRRLPGIARERLSDRVARVPLEVGLNRLFLDPHYDIDAMIASLSRALSVGELDQRFLYMGADSVQHWKKAVTGGRYHTYEHCLAALQRLLITEEWKKLVGDGSFDAIIDLGCGTGQKLARIGKSLLEFPSNSHVLISFLDTSLYMLEATSKNVTELGDDYPGRIAHNGYCTDFLDLRGIVDVWRARKQCIFLCLGNTFANTKEETFFRSVENHSNPGDVLMLGVEFLDLSEPSKERDEAIDQFKDENIKALALSAVRLVPRFRHITEINGSLAPNISEPREFSDLPDVRAVKLTVKFSNREVVVAYSNRYEQTALREFVEKHSFEYLFETASPANRRYKILVFRRKPRRQQKPPAPEVKR